MNNLFYKLTNQCSIISDVKLFIQQDIHWEWVPYVYFSKDFKTNHSQRLVEQDFFLKALHKKYKGTELHLYKFPSMTFYTWHKDKKIGCSLNMVLDDYDSNTIFMPEPKKDLINSITNLNYEKENWYLFNSQILHSVVNLDVKDRILLTFTFPLTVSFENVKSYITENLDL